jgi:3-isopropylmalate/(R)-2-methylmalate dehydratase small subunit
VDLINGKIENLTRGKSCQARPIPPFMERLIKAGGLVEHIRKEKLQKQP